VGYLRTALTLGASKHTKLQSLGQGAEAKGSEFCSWSRLQLPEFITLCPLGYIERHSQTSPAEQTQLPYLNKQVNLEA